MSIDEDNKTLDNQKSDDEKHKEANELKEKGNAFVKKKDYANAIEMYTSAIEMFDQDAVYFSNRSQCYLSLEKYAECIEDSERAIELDPNHYKSFYRRTVAFEKLGNDMQAMISCRALLDLTPEDQGSKNTYDRLSNRLLDEQKKKERARIRWSKPSSRAHYTDFVEKSPHKRSQQPMQKIPVQVRKIPTPIPEALIDKLFNNNTGETIHEPETDSKLFKPNFFNKPVTSSPPKTEKVDAPIIEDKKKLNEANEILKATENKKDAIPTLQELEARKCNLIVLPKTGPQFYSAWKEIDEQQRFLYLKNIADQTAPIGRLLGAQLDSQLLSEIIFIIHKYFTHFKLPHIRLLKDLGLNGELKMLAMFMDDVDKKCKFVHAIVCESDSNRCFHFSN